MRFYLFAIWLASSSALAQIYQYTDSHGNKVYTNQPPSGVSSQPIRLQTPNTIEAIAAPPLTESPQATDEPNYHQLVAQLPDDEALRANNGSFSVRVEIEPELNTGHRLQLLVDGMPHGPALAATTLEATNLARGEHVIAVQVVSKGRILQQSAGQTLTIQRVNTNSPALRPTPQPRATP